jgi:hypothetical protein
MPYDFYIPTDPVDWTRATLNEEGTIVVHDYDIEYDLVLDAFGDDPSLVLDIISYWNDDPILFLCGKNEIIPITDCGVAAWAWATEAINSRQDDLCQQPSLRAELNNALKAAFSALTKNRIPFKRVLVARRNVANMIADTTSYHYGKMVKTRTADAMTAVRQLLDGIIQMVQDVEYSGYVSNIDHFCNVAVSTSKALRPGLVKEVWEEDELSIEDFTPFLIEVGVRAMGKVQKNRGVF